MRFLKTMLPRRIAPLTAVSAALPALAILLGLTGADRIAREGYYRFPAIHGDVVVFVAEGDLWRVPATGGVAQRLTTHPSEEMRPVLSPDGSTIAYSASYEGPREVYTMPAAGGSAVRQTWDGGGADVVGWTPDGRILYTTQKYATLPNAQLVAVSPCGRDVGDLEHVGDDGGVDEVDVRPRQSRAAAGTRATVCSPERQRIPLWQASEGAFAADGTLYFTRLAWQGSHTKRYRGGTAQNLWAWSSARPEVEAWPLTSDFDGTSKAPMPWRGRVYFASDRDGVMNLWSMAEDGGDLRQHTSHTDFDVQSPAMHEGRIVYQSGADLWLFDATAGQATQLAITLASDFDHMRENWVEQPIDYLTSAHLSPDGDRVALTSRGRVFVAPVGPGRFVEVTRTTGVRYRDAAFLPGGDRLIALSDESGEVEVWTLPANGIGERTQLTEDAAILRWSATPSPDGKRIAHHDKNQHLYIYDVETKTDRRIATNTRMSAWISSAPGFFDHAWSPDGRWLAYNDVAENYLGRIVLYDTQTDTHTPVTTDRYDSYSPAWSPDGKWLWLLSDRSFTSSVRSPWGARQPDPYFDKRTQIYGIALRAGEEWPFEPRNELQATRDSASSASRADSAASEDSPAPVAVTIDLDGIASRLFEVPVPPGNYSSLTTDGERLYWMSLVERSPRKVDLNSIAIETPTSNEEDEAEPVIEDVSSYEMSLDRKKLMVRKGSDLFVFDAGAKAPSSLTSNKVDLSGWSFSVDPREEWLHHFVDAWRLERDYFYDPGMHGVDWPAMREKYLPLARRVTDRAELNDVIAQMVGELSALHIFVRGGDQRSGTDDIAPASLGAVLERDPEAGGWRVSHIYRSDPDIPSELSPLAAPGVSMSEGDVILAIDGVETLSVPDPAVLLRNKAGRQVLLRVRAGGSDSSGSSGSPPGQRSAGPRGEAMAERDVIVTPITQRRERDLRYDEWEYTRRLAVDSLGGGRVGYVHLRAMGSGNITEWTREYYPVFNRDALIIDVRHNRGGNIDSWLLGNLLRREWFWWQPRVGEPYHNMPYAFRGPIVVLMNERTASDGEAFAEGFRRLGLGELIGTRTWGGEIWLSSSNFLADRGIATAAEQGVFADGQWLIEGWGVDPDTVVDNLPVATWRGEDAQLEAAVKHLEADARRSPVANPEAPSYPRGRGRLP